MDTKTVLAQIDSVLQSYGEIERNYSRPSSDRDGSTYISPPELEGAEIITLLEDTIKRLTPPGRCYGQWATSAIPKGIGWEGKTIRTMAGVLKALRADYAADRLQTFKELVHSDLFSDFLEMAEYLIADENLKDPAAVMAGDVLEQHLRALCDKHGLSTVIVDGKGRQCPKKLDMMNADLGKQGVYGKNDQKQVTAWAGIRNSAAHADYDKYAGDQVTLMIQGVRDFISRFPA